MPDRNIKNEVQLLVIPVVQLEALPGIDDAYAKMIIAGRPYANRDELKNKKVIPEAAYKKIEDLIVAKQPKK